MNRFLDTISDPIKALTKWKEENKRKIIGCTPMHIPEEPIHAAGMLPVVLWESNEPITQAHAHIQPFFCGYVRSIIDMALKGELGFLDGMIFSDDCLAIQDLNFLVAENVAMSYHEYIHLPSTPKASASRAYLIDEVNKFKVSLEAFGGHEISEESLQQSIIIYNKNRALLRRLYQLRRQNPGIIKAKEVLAIVQSSMLMPKEEHSKLLEELLPELEKRKPVVNGKTRLFLSGSLCQAPKIDILDLIEEEGGIVVDDDIYTGFRYFATDARTTGNPIEALADREINAELRCPTKTDPDNDWADQIVQKVKQAQAQGVITLQVKCCEPHLFSHPDIEEKLNKNKIPELFLEVEHEIMSLEPIRTRVSAFIEALEVN